MSSPKILPRHALQEILDECGRTTKRRRRDYLTLMLMGRAGLRSIEARSLTPQNVKTDASGFTWLHLTTVKRTVANGKGNPKRGRKRSIPCPLDLAGALADWYTRDYDGGKYLLSGDSLMARSTVYRMVERVALDAGYPDTHPHMLRHTCISDWVHAGLALHDVASMSGHASLTQLQVYLHTRPDELARRVASL